MKQRFLNPKGLLMLVAGFMAISFSGCKNETPTPPSAPSLVILDESGQPAPANYALTAKVEGEEFNIGVQSTRDWAISGKPEWLTITPTTGSAGKTTSVKITATANPGELRGPVTLTVAANDASKSATITVTQRGAAPANLMAIKDLRVKYTGTDVDLTEDKVIMGSVISASNSTSTKSIVIQDDEAGIALRFAADPSPAYVLGEEVIISLKDLKLSAYMGMVQLTQGTAGIPAASATKSGLIDVKTAKSITAAQLVGGTFESMYVAVSDVQFISDALDKKINDASFLNTGGHAVIGMESQDAKTFAMFSSKYANFFTNDVPDKSGVIKGIAGINIDKGVTTYQIQPQSAADFDGLTGARFDEADRFGVSSKAISVAAVGGEKTVNVTGNVAWTASVTEGATYLDGDISPKSGTGAGAITMTFKENTSTTADNVVKVTVVTTAEVGEKSIEVVFTQSKKSDAVSGLFFPGSDINNWDTFLASLNKYKVSYGVFNATGGREGSGALHLNQKVGTTNSYIFTAIVPDPANVPTKSISFYINGTCATKSLSIDFFKADGTKAMFNLGTCTTDDIVLEAKAQNDYAGSINTNGQWVKITLNTTGLTLISEKDKDMFAFKYGKDATYDLLIDDITFE